MSEKRTKLLSIIAILTIIGGVFSVVTSLPLYGLYNSMKQDGITVENKVSIVEVQPDTPAAHAQLKTGDTIISVNGQNISSSSEFTEVSSRNRGKIIDIVIERQGSTRTVQLTPRENPPSGEGRVGIVLANTGVEEKPLYQIIPEVITRSYSGREEKPASFLSPVTTIYQDKSYSRIKSLIVGIISILIGMGLWKLKKWAMYVFFLLTGYSLIVMIPYLLNPANYTYTQPGILFRPPTIIDTLTYIGSLTIELLFAVYIYSQRKIFK